MKKFQIGFTRHFINDKTGKVRATLVGTDFFDVEAETQEEAEKKGKNQLLCMTRELDKFQFVSCVENGNKQWSETL